MKCIHKLALRIVFLNVLPMFSFQACHLWNSFTAKWIIWDAQIKRNIREVWLKLLIQYLAKTDWFLFYSKGCKLQFHRIFQTHSKDGSKFTSAYNKVVSAFCWFLPENICPLKALINKMLTKCSGAACLMVNPERYMPRASSCDK